MDDKIKQVFASVFQISGDQVTDALSPQDVPSWDSLGHVRLVTALQETFGVELDVEEIMRMENVAEIKKILEARA